VALIAAACASEDHSWRGEFDARLEGAAAAIEEETANIDPRSKPDEIIALEDELGRPLEFKSELIGRLHPPAGCEEVQERGRRAVGGTAQLSATLYKNLTPYLQRKLPAPFEEALATLEEIEREAATCE
jgi:hypothetical protein